MEEKFSCYYERDEKGIYFELDTESYENLVGLTFFVDFKVQGEVCLDKEDVKRLISLLQKSLED